MVDACSWRYVPLDDRDLDRAVNDHRRSAGAAPGDGETRWLAQPDTDTHQRKEHATGEPASEDVPGGGGDGQIEGAVIVAIVPAPRRLCNGWRCRHAIQIAP